MHRTTARCRRPNSAMIEGAVRAHRRGTSSMRRWQDSSKHQIGSPDGTEDRGRSSIRSSRTGSPAPERVAKPANLGALGHAADAARLQGRRSAGHRRAPRLARRIWGSPRSTSTRSSSRRANHRYHTHDYYQVDPLLGGNDAFDELLAACHGRGHAGGARRGVQPRQPRVLPVQRHPRERGRTRPGSTGSTSTDRHSTPTTLRTCRTTTPGGACTALPKFNTDNPQVREFLMGVGEHWTAARASMDGASTCPEEIKTPRASGRSSAPRVRAVNPEAYLVGEIWGNGVPTGSAREPASTA